MPASASAGAPGGLKDRADRRASVDLTYPYEYLGAGPHTLDDGRKGKHAFASVLKDAAKRPLVIVGAGAHARAPMARRAVARRAHLLRGSAGKEAAWNALQRSAYRGLARRRT